MGTIGNPLLDISANVPAEVLEKYSLDANNAILAEESHMPIYQDLIDNHQVDYVAEAPHRTLLEWHRLSWAMTSVLHMWGA